MKNGVKRGRPLKFGRRGQLVAVTLPREVVRGLRRLHPDLAWAIVTLFERHPERFAGDKPEADAELVSVAGERSLIVVNRHVFKQLPGINMIRLHGNRAFLALDPGRGIADLELAVVDRLASRPLAARERLALEAFRTKLRKWRRDPTLQCHTRSIIVVEPANGKRRSA